MIFQFLPKENTYNIESIVIFFALVSVNFEISIIKTSLCSSVAINIHSSCAHFSPRGIFRIMTRCFFLLFSAHFIFKLYVIVEICNFSAINSKDSSCEYKNGTRRLEHTVAFVIPVSFGFVLYSYVSTIRATNLPNI